MAKVIVQEAGCLVPLLSLGGILSKSGRGRQMMYDTIAATVAGASLLHANLLRISAILQNVDTVDITVSFYPDLGGLVLKPGGSIQIDKDFPWTGPAYASVAVGTANVSVHEVAITE